MFVLIHLSGIINVKQTVILSGEIGVLELSQAGTNRVYSLRSVCLLCRGMPDMQTKQSAGGCGCDGDDKGYIILRSRYDRPRLASASDPLALLYQVNKKIN